MLPALLPTSDYEKSPAGTKPTGLPMLMPFYLISSGNKTHTSLETEFETLYYPNLTKCNNQMK